MPIALFSELTHRLFKVMDKSDDKLLDVTNLMDRLTLDGNFIYLLIYILNNDRPFD